MTVSKAILCPPRLFRGQLCYCYDGYVAAVCIHSIYFEHSIFLSQMTKNECLLIHYVPEQLILEYFICQAATYLYGSTNPNLPRAFAGREGNK